MRPHLSVIIPAHNEAERIPKTLRAINNFLKAKGYEWEIIVVDDGSTDMTANIVRSAAGIIPNLSLVQLSGNLGKGAAVKAGMLHARGDARLFSDADNSTSIEQVDKLLPFFQEGYDVVVGSRRMPGASIKVRQQWLREALGATFRMLSHILVSIPVRDTQNGFKLFSADAADILFKELQTNGWSFDVEVLARAQTHNFKIREVPVEWKNDNRSRLRFAHMAQMAVELLKISAAQKLAHWV
jgi:dolichyl-phosphate beta-glucosyltransferase